MTLEIRNLSRRYGAAPVLAGIDLDVADGEFLALLGPSGAGKTTLLRLIAGLDRPDSGDILIDGADLRTLAPRDRRIGFVFQNYALFRHMTVARNIAFGLSVKPRRQRRSRHDIKARVGELLDLMRLSGLGDRFPAQLSGGQRQRVALARALAIDPQVLLLDEPFGALDARVRSELRAWLRDLQRQLRLTTIFVTHDQHEAFQLADRIAILNTGFIEQAGPPAEIHKRPRTPFVREFIGAADCTGHPIEFIDIVPPSGPAAEPCPKGGPIGPASKGLPRAGHCATRHSGTASQVCGPSSSWTPRAPAGLPDTSASGDLPAMAAGDLWLIALPATGCEPTSLERHALTAANVIVYDRALTDAVAAVLPLGGYAEPTDGDGLARSLQFVRDGWSVVRLIGRLPSEDRDGTYRQFAQQLRDAVAFPGWRLRRIVRRDGRWLFADDTRLADPDPLSVRGAGDAGEAIVISAPGGAAPDLYATACNGLAG